MTLREIAVRIGCFTAALGLGSCLHVRAEELQTSEEAVPHTTERCAVSIAPVGKAVSCERIGGHLRIESMSRFPGQTGFGRPEASPAAVRTDGGIQSNGRLYLPGGQSGFDPFRR